MSNEHSNIVPSMQPTAKVADFKFWCQKVLPLVYDDSLSYYEVLGKMVVYLNQVIDNINADIDNVAELEDDFLLLQSYVNNFFDDIDQLVTYAERAEAAETSAIGYAASAAESATNASTSSLAAMDAKDAAVAAKTAAETALANAQTAATNAATSATAADASKDAAAASALSASGSAINASTSATAAQNSATLADTARSAAQTAATNADSSATAAANSATDAAAAISGSDISNNYSLNTNAFTVIAKSIIRFGPFIFFDFRLKALTTDTTAQVWTNIPVVGNTGINGDAWQRMPTNCMAYSSNIADPIVAPSGIGDKILRIKGVQENWYYEVSGFFKHNLS